MDTIRIDVTGDQQVGIRFEEFPDALYEDLRGEIDDLSQQLYGLVVALAPSDKGDLKSKVRRRLFTDPTRITGYVDIAGVEGSQDFAKAGALEYGAHRARGLTAAHAMRLDHHWSLKLAAPEIVIVEAHGRPPNIAEHAFERGPLAAMRPEVLARLNAVVERVVADANA